jgi:DNA-binding response OmpR family regulator
MANTIDILNQETILIVDDIPDNLALLSDMLKDYYKIKVANSGERALRIMTAEKPPDMLLLDIMMPEMNGFAVCHKLKENPLMKDVPIIFISALTNTDDIVRAFKEGGVDYITKPFQLDEVLARVNVQMELKRSKAELQSLLSKTLTGSIQVMIDLLTLSKPMLVDQSNRIRRYARELMSNIPIHPQEVWIVDLAVMLSQIGCLSISEQTLRKRYSGLHMNVDETRLFEQHSSIGADILARIPRMEKIAEIIRNQFVHPSKLQYEHADIVFIGSAILNMLLEYDLLVSKGVAPILAVNRLKNHSSPYTLMLVNHLETMINAEVNVPEICVSLGALQPGMVLKEDILNREDVVLLPKGTEMSASLIQLLDRFYKQGQCASSQVYVLIKTNNQEEICM